MIEFLIGVVAGTVAGAGIVIGIAFIVAMGNDHDYLEYPPEEMERGHDEGSVDN